MFVKLADSLTLKKLDRFDVFNFLPLQLAGFKEAVWETWRKTSAGALPIAADAGLGIVRLGRGPADIQAPLVGALRSLDSGIISNDGRTDLGGDVFLDVVESLLTDLRESAQVGRFWHHLFYAYAIENTGAERICRRVVQLALNGESLGGLSEAGHRWLRATEELFYRDGAMSLIPSITSGLRPDARATRRNAYQRMFGIELNHGTDDNRPFPYDKAEACNRDFIPTFEAFLREVWSGYTNATNTSGPKTTDRAGIAELAAQMSQMLTDRRQHGTLSREEYASVCAMSWFHLTVSGYGPGSSPIVVDLKAEATTPEERLRRLGERVGLPVHGKARSLFKLADLVSALFIELEQERYNDVSDVDALFDPAVAPDTSSDLLTIINHWKEATGHNIKATPVTAGLR